MIHGCMGIRITLSTLILITTFLDYNIELCGGLEKYWHLYLHGVKGNIGIHVAGTLVHVLGFF